MASLTDVNAPGAYPTTPLAEETTSQAQRIETHGRGTGLGQETHPSGHNFSGSGIYVDEPSLGYGADHSTSSSQRNPLQQTLRNEEIPRSLGNDSPSNRAGESDKPGLMTGAYSRVGTRDSSFAPIGNYTYDKNSPSDSSHDATLPQLRNEHNTRSVGTETEADPANPTSTTASGTTTGLNDAEHSSGSQGQSNNTAKQDPYWGDIPFGTGIYNGVTGHGSKEPITTHQGTLHDEYGTAGASQGVYNGVTGHGSKESKTPVIPELLFEERSRDAMPTSANTNTNTNEKEASRQRKFPLVGGTANTGSTAAAVSDRDRDVKHDRAGENTPKSHVKEVLAGAGATGAAGYAAHDFLGRDRDAQGKGTDRAFADEKPVAGQGGFAAGSQSQAQAHPQAHPHGGKQGLVDRTVGAAPGIKESRTSERQFDNNRVNEMNKNEESHRQYLGAAAATAGVGAGAYGLHEHAARDNAKENTSASGVGGSEVLMAAPSGTTRDLAQRDTQPMYSTTTQDFGREQSRDNMLSGGEYSGLASRGAKPFDTNRYPSGPSQARDRNAPFDNKDNGVSRATQHGDTQATEKPVITDPTYGGRYNVLSSGTPSGIALDQSHSTKSGH
ncbi:hypothetical protein F5B17DRAFT_447884 [Nemania serpens]|nr:hypothetical protein F5B17DRAFT_447884 [Nemania serpens]